MYIVHGMNTKQIVKHNAAIKATHDMSVVEQKLVLMCIAQLRRDNPNNSRHFTIRHDEFCREAGYKASTKVFSTLKAAAMRLQTRLLIINEKIIDDDGKEWDGGAISVLSKHVYAAGSGEIKLSFSDEFMPYLQQLSSDYTRYLLKDCMGMTSAYSMRIYELVRMKYNQDKRYSENHNIVEYTISVEDLRIMFGLLKKYKVHANFKARVLDTAVREINEYSPLNVEYGQIKRGRKIDKIVFKITAKASEFAVPVKKKRRTNEDIILDKIEGAKKALGAGL